MSAELTLAIIFALTAAIPQKETVDGDVWTRSASAKSSYNANAMNGWTPSAFRAPIPTSAVGVTPVTFHVDPAISTAFSACTEPPSTLLRAQGRNPNDCTTYGIYALLGQPSVMAPYAYRSRVVNGSLVSDLIAVWRIPIDNVEWTSYIHGCPQP